MADSDGEYVDGFSDDDLGDHRARNAVDNHYGTRSKAVGRAPRVGEKRKAKATRARFETIQKSWEAVTEAPDGTITATIELLDAQKQRRRLLRDTTPLQRGIIRHLMLVLDLSFAMGEKDLIPTRYILTLRYAVDFVREFYEQNPISQMGIVGMRDGIAVRISDMGGNPAEHIEQLWIWAEQQEPQGNPSLQNALEMCRGALYHTPSHGTREILIVYGALMSNDPGDVSETLQNLLVDRIRVKIIGLSAHMAVCADLCARTNGGDDEGAHYAVALHEQHFRELFLAATTPPVTGTVEQQQAGLLMMGFPSRQLAASDKIGLCACHQKPRGEGYACTRCGTRVCRLPTECPSCGLTLILSTHLARSYHHLFPLRNWVAVPWSQSARSRACFACQTPFPGRPRGEPRTAARRSGDGGRTDATREDAKATSESGRYACDVCGNHFCIDCDLYAHEVIHNCPGCQSDTRARTVGLPHVPNGGGAEAMEVDL